MVAAHQKLITSCTADFSSRKVVGFIAVLVNAVIVGTPPEDVFLVASIVGVCRLLWPTEMPKRPPMCCRGTNPGFHKARLLAKDPSKFHSPVFADPSLYCYAQHFPSPIIHQFIGGVAVALKYNLHDPTVAKSNQLLCIVSGFH